MEHEILYKVIDKEIRGFRTVRMVLNTLEDGYYVFWNLYFNTTQEKHNFKIFKTKKAAENFFNGCLETLDFLAG